MPTENIHKLYCPTFLAEWEVKEGRNQEGQGAGWVIDLPALPTEPAIISLQVGMVREWHGDMINSKSSTFITIITM